MREAPTLIHSTHTTRTSFQSIWPRGATLAGNSFRAKERETRLQGVKKERPQRPSAVNIPAGHDMREKPAQPSSLDLSHRTSPRSRYNSAFVSKTAEDPLNRT
ncbi:hypothetical protein GQ44DRAFT_827834 [Phaeosphaeriaceae sp. PMI808]|nr:hypothetical protein GQ44DRAFT_827834 [Phaeosphaeriaceae sp. PMI808]